MILLKFAKDKYGTFNICVNFLNVNNYLDRSCLINIGFFSYNFFLNVCNNASSDANMQWIRISQFLKCLVGTPFKSKVFIKLI